MKQIENGTEFKRLPSGWRVAKVDDFCPLNGTMVKGSGVWMFKAWFGGYYCTGMSSDRAIRKVRHLPDSKAGGA